MLTIYLKSYNKIIRDADVKLLEELGYDDILWIDMFNPTIRERKSVEVFMALNLQTQQQIEEIESSSRYSETEKAVYCNTNFLIVSENVFDIETVSFVVSNGVLVSERASDFKTFSEVSKRLQINYNNYPTGSHILVSILEVRIDMDADMVESVSRRVTQLNKHLSVDTNINADTLRTINTLQDSCMVLRENIFDRQRVVSSIMRSSRFPDDTYPLLTIMVKDIGSLLNHADFNLNRLDYLQDATMGLINIEQNNITKIFTIVSVFFMPPTLIASLYGMNFMHMPALQSEYGYLLPIFGMIVIALVTYLYLKRKKWL